MEGLIGLVGLIEALLTLVVLYIASMLIVETLDRIFDLFNK